MSEDVAAIEALAKRFFDAIEAGDVVGVGACYADDVVIWHNTDGAAQGKADNLQVLSGLVRGFPTRSYAERRLTAFPGGFVQQHVLRATNRSGGQRELAAAIVCAVSGGKITRLDEYFDSAHVAAFTAS